MFCILYYPSVDYRYWCGPLIPKCVAGHQQPGSLNCRQQLRKIQEIYEQQPWSCCCAGPRQLRSGPVSEPAAVLSGAGD